MAILQDLMRRLFLQPNHAECPARPYRPEPCPLISVGGNHVRSRIVICAPEQLDQTESIVDLLQSGSSVLLNLETGRRDIARRLLDFVAGVAYHNENQIQGVAPSVYLILPYDAEVESDGYYGKYCS